MSTEIEKVFGLTDDQLDAYEAEYLSDDWSHMCLSEIKQGRPKLFNDELCTISVKIPNSYLQAILETGKKLGMNRSEFIRSAIEKELSYRTR